MPEDRLSIFHIKRDAAVACLVYLVLGITVAATFVLVLVRVQTVLRSKKVGSCLAIAGRFKRRVLNPGAFSIVPRLRRERATLRQGLQLIDRTEEPSESKTTREFHEMPKKWERRERG